MSFQVPCPNCGPRSAYEYRFGGEYRESPAGPQTSQDRARHVYMRRNVAGVQREWWFHRQGCGRWFLAERDTRTNAVLSTAWPGEAATDSTP